MKRTLGRRILRNSLVLTSTLLACTTLQAQQGQFDRTQGGDRTQVGQSANEQSQERLQQAQDRRHAIGHSDSKEMTAAGFIHKALMGGRMEVQAGRLAQQKGQSQQVKDLGATLVQDHTMANQSLEQLASKKNIQVSQSSLGGQPNPGSPSTSAGVSSSPHQGTLGSSGLDTTTSQGRPGTRENNKSSSLGGVAAETSDNLSAQGAPGANQHGGINASEHAGQANQHGQMMSSKMARKQQEFNRLQSLSGDQFDKAFVRMIVADHNKDIAEFQKARTQLQDPQLDAFIDETLPKLEKHLQMAQSAAQSLGVDTSKIAADRDEDNDAATGSPAAGSIGTRGSDRTKDSLNNDAGNNTTGLDKKRSSLDYQSDPNPKITTDNDPNNGKVFQKGDGKVLGLSTDKNDGKYLGIIPAPGKKDDQEHDASFNAGASVNGNDASIGGAATTETGSDKGK